MRKSIAVFVSVLVAFGVLFGAPQSARAAADPLVFTINHEYIIVDATISDANLQTPLENSRVVIEVTGKGWAWVDEFTYYPQRVNVYQAVGALNGDISWRIVDTRDPSVEIADGTVDGTQTMQDTIDVYGADGHYEVNGRQWLTSCEPYSQTYRCRTDIWATQIQETSPGTYVNKNGWAFNNLTYLPLMERADWAGNPLGGYAQVGYEGEWTSADGRDWRVECDTALSGRGGCRSFILATVVEPANSAATSFRKVDKWLFNNIVRFG